MPGGTSQYAADLVPGAYYQRSPLSFTREAARIVGSVVLAGTSEDTRGALIEAANVAIAHHGVTHPDNSILRLRTARAEMAGTATARVVMDYARGDSDSALEGDGFSGPDITLGYFADDEYAFLGVDLLAPLRIGTASFSVRTVHRPIWNVRIPWVLGYSPFSYSVDKAGKVNSVEVEWSGGTQGTHTVLYQGMRQSSSINDGTYTFRGEYHFTFRPDGWHAQEPTENGTIGTVNMYEATTFLPSATFFPVNG